MKIPHTINPNFFKAYEPSKIALSLVPESKRNIKSEDSTWDESRLPNLTELCLMVIIANFERRVILNQLPCWDRNALLESLPTDLPLNLVIKYIKDGIYWKRKVKDRWKDNANHVEDYGFDWRRMYMERHVQEAIEAMTPEGYDFDTIKNLCELSKRFVKVLDLRELQIKQPFVLVNEEDEFNIMPDPKDHIDLDPIITGLENLTELHVRFGLRNVGSDYKKSSFQFSIQDCRNLGAGVGKSKNLRLLRVHSCNLNDDGLIALLSSMEPNVSLEELNFSNCMISDDGATGIAKYLKNRSNIRKVNLCNNNIGELGVSAIAFIITQSHASPLDSLNLKFNSFENTGFRFLASALVRDRCHIRKLNVSCCNLTKESGIFVGETLNRNSTLTDMDLSNNHLGLEAGRAIKSAMQKNTTIQTLDLRMTEIPESDLLTINNQLHLNRIRALKGEKAVEKEYSKIEMRTKLKLKQIEEEIAEIKNQKEDTEKLPKKGANKSITS